ncbi:SdpI family protein [Clostridium sp. SYSU_GA19001]|uniref:SdpI family protein n=1 Tax=Clostridium caldaquaticum TaxID=2940653 RepID=UPI0020770214|nr:SdpI family protein [Clostridium caldaquaticum]MCM8710204.1 SdpI family protein [Clostridium caldaquaticum]
MDIFYFVIDLIIPLIMIISGAILKMGYLKKINSFIGYRTNRSKLSQQAWDFANKQLGNYNLKIGVILACTIVIFTILLPEKSKEWVVIYLFIEVIAVLVSIPLIEHKLKVYYDSK